jgi:hypothetical protein
MVFGLITQTIKFKESLELLIFFSERLVKTLIYVHNTVYNIKEL